MAKFVEQSVTSMNINIGVLKHIEKCARVCYKSEDKITDNSAGRMIASLRRSGHTSTFEHYRVCVKVPMPIYEYIYSSMPDENKRYFKFANGLISANIRAWYEAMNINKYINRICKIIAFRMHCLECFGLEDGWDYEYDPDVDFCVDIIDYDELPKEHKWHTFRIITDRGITHEIVRHRKLSYSQESTRWINYGNKDMEFVLPIDVDIDTIKDIIMPMLLLSETTYQALIFKGLKPQDARDILPTCLKTEIVVTGLDEDFEWFVELRSGPNAHPKISTIASIINCYITHQ